MDGDESKECRACAEDGCLKLPERSETTSEKESRKKRKNEDRTREELDVDGIKV